MNFSLLLVALMSMAGLQPPSRLLGQVAPTSSVQTVAEAASVTIPSATGTVAQPELSAKAAYAVDASTGTQLYAKDADTARPIASLTKLMTMLVIMRDHKPDEVVTIPPLAPYRRDDALAGLVTGDQLTVRNLMAASLIPSDNDAADSLAIYDSGTKESFYGKMNSIAQDWGLSAHFASASGLQDANNQATARDVATMARLGLKNSLFRELTSTKQASISSGQGRVYRLVTTNLLLDNVRTFGVKTGFTPAAGQCFVSLSKVHGHDVITVVLGSYDRFGETTKLLDWLTATYTWQTIN